MIAVNGGTNGGMKMGLSFRKSFKVAPGVRFSVSTPELAAG